MKVLLRYNSGARQVLSEIGVSVASVGHDHCNDYCLQDTQQSLSPGDNKMWLCLVEEQDWVDMVDTMDTLEE